MRNILLPLIKMQLPRSIIRDYEIRRNVLSSDTSDVTPAAEFQPKCDKRHPLQMFVCVSGGALVAAPVRQRDASITEKSGRRRSEPARRRLAACHPWESHGMFWVTRWALSFSTKARTGRCGNWVAHPPTPTTPTQQPPPTFACVRARLENADCFLLIQLIVAH